MAEIYKTQESRGFRLASHRYVACHPLGAMFAEKTGNRQKNGVICAAKTIWHCPTSFSDLEWGPMSGWTHFCEKVCTKFQFDKFRFIVEFIPYHALKKSRMS